MEKENGIRQDAGKAKWPRSSAPDRRENSLPPSPGSECGTCKGTGMQNLIGCPGAQGECEDCGGCGRDIDGMTEEELDKYLSTFIDDMPAFRERVKAKKVEFAEKYRRMLERNSQNVELSCEGEKHEE